MKKQKSLANLSSILSDRGASLPRTELEQEAATPPLIPLKRSMSRISMVRRAPGETNEELLSRLSTGEGSSELSKIIGLSLKDRITLFGSFEGMERKEEIAIRPGKRLSKLRSIIEENFSSGSSTFEVATIAERGAAFQGFMHISSKSFRLISPSNSKIHEIPFGRRRIKMGVARNANNQLMLQVGSGARLLVITDTEESRYILWKTFLLANAYWHDTPPVPERLLENLPIRGTVLGKVRESQAISLRLWAIGEAKFELGDISVTMNTTEVIIKKLNSQTIIKKWIDATLGFQTGNDESVLTVKIEKEEVALKCRDIDQRNVLYQCFVLFSTSGVEELPDEEVQDVENLDVTLSPTILPLGKPRELGVGKATPMPSRGAKIEKGLQKSRFSIENDEIEDENSKLPEFKFSCALVNKKLQYLGEAEIVIGGGETAFKFKSVFEEIVVSRNEIGQKVKLIPSAKNGKVIGLRHLVPEKRTLHLLFDNNKSVEHLLEKFRELLLDAKFAQKQRTERIEIDISSIKAAEQSRIEEIDVEFLSKEAVVLGRGTIAITQEGIELKGAPGNPQKIAGPLSKAKVSLHKEEKSIVCITAPGYREFVHFKTAEISQGFKEDFRLAASELPVTPRSQSGTRTKSPMRSSFNEEEMSPRQTNSIESNDVLSRKSFAREFKMRAQAPQAIFGKRVFVTKTERREIEFRYASGKYWPLENAVLDGWEVALSIAQEGHAESHFGLLAALINVFESNEASDELVRISLEQDLESQLRSGTLNPNILFTSSDASTQLFSAYCSSLVHMTRYYSRLLKELVKVFYKNPGAEDDSKQIEEAVKCIVGSASWVPERVKQLLVSIKNMCENKGMRRESITKLVSRFFFESAVFPAFRRIEEFGVVKKRMNKTAKEVLYRRIELIIEELEGVFKSGQDRASRDTEIERLVMFFVNSICKKGDLEANVFIPKNLPLNKTVLELSWGVLHDFSFKNEQRIIERIDLLIDNEEKYLKITESFKKAIFDLGIPIPTER